MSGVNVFPEIAFLPDLFRPPSLDDRDAYADVVALLQRARTAAFLSSLCDGELERELMRRARALDDPTARHRFCDLLGRLQLENRFIGRATSRVWAQDDEDWLDEAYAVADEADVSAVIASSGMLKARAPHPKSHAPGAGLSELHCLFDACLSTTFRKSSTEITQTFAPLFSRVASLQVVDPYLFAKHDGPNDQRRLGLIAVARACSGNRVVPLERFELHTSWHECDESIIAREQYRLRGLLEPLDLEVRLKVVFWEAKGAGRDLHDRYLLTERVGLRLSNSLDLAQADAACSLMSVDDRRKVAADYQTNSTTYQFVRSIEI